MEGPRETGLILGPVGSSKLSGEVVAEADTLIFALCGMHSQKRKKERSFLEEFCLNLLAYN